MKVVLSAIFLAFVAYIWVRAPTFGSQPECNNSTKYVVFFYSVLATDNAVRYTFLALMVVATVSAVFNYILVAVFTKFFKIICGCHQRDNLAQGVLPREDIEMLVGIASRIRIKTSVKKTRKRPKWLPTQHDVRYTTCYTITNVYGVVMLELTVSRNKLGEDEKKWTFGQILALFLLFSVAAEVANIILAQVDRQVESKKSKVAGTTVMNQQETSAEVPVGESVITQPATAVTRTRE